jgi:hypothetical protein
VFFVRDLAPRRKAGQKSFNCDDQGSPTWQERTELAVDLIQLAVSKHCAIPRIMDIGCGDMKLDTEIRSRLLNRQNYEYLGLDLIPQHTAVRQIDVVRDDLPRMDIAVALGIGEYIDLDTLFEKVRNRSNYFVLSHVISDDGSYPPPRVKQLGWVNHLSSKAITERLQKHRLRTLSRRLSLEKTTMLWLCH